MTKPTLAEYAAVDVKLALLKFGKAEAQRIAASWQHEIGVDAAQLVQRACDEADAIQAA